jgi:hypothetical protein
MNGQPARSGGAAMATLKRDPDASFGRSPGRPFAESGRPPRTIYDG